MPRLTLTAGSVLVMFLIGTVAFLYFWNRKKISATVGAVADAVNPTKDTNLAYRAASSAVSTLTGKDDSFGGILADTFNPAARQVNKEYAPPNIPSPTQTVITPEDFTAAGVGFGA